MAPQAKSFMEQLFPSTHDYIDGTAFDSPDVRVPTFGTITPEHKEEIKNEAMKRLGRIRYEEGPRTDDKGITKAASTGYGVDDTGKIRNRTIGEMASGLTKEEAQTGYDNYSREAGITRALSGNTKYTFGDDVVVTAAGLGVDPPSREDIKTVAQATKLMREKLLKVMNANTQKQAAVADRIKYGTLVPGEGGKPGVRTGGTVEGHRETETFRREGETHQSGLDVDKQTINASRALAALQQQEFNWKKADAVRERNQEIKVLDIKNAAAVLQREAENANIIKLHGLQHESNMEFFDKKKEAYEQERFMDYIQGGVNGLGSLFQLLWL